MKRAFLVTTSTVVGVAAVLGYKPNSDTAQALLDITGASNTSSTSTTTADPTTAPAAPQQTAAAEPTAAAPQETTAAPASTTPKATTKPKPATKPKATKKPKATPTKQASQGSSATTTQPAATEAPAPTPTPTPTKAAGVSKTVTGDAAQANAHGTNYGMITVTVTLVDGKMTKITATQNPEGRNYPYIQAVRQYLIPAVLKAQKANVGYVQGATSSSQGFIDSLQSALSKV